ncbi:MAG: hypothetical protein PHG23_02410 [Candidatus Pacebacteria bacterium]|nr:hypothetical protein [Candidatus Paceibacterota bacterium]
MAVKVKFESEQVACNVPASVRVYDNDNLVAEITGTVEKQTGIDGGKYPAVKLTKK